MAGQLLELFNSRTEVQSEHATAEFNYVAMGCADEGEVRTLALGLSPVAYNGMVRSSVEITERINADTWKVIVRFALADNTKTDPNAPLYTFDSTGGTQHITQSKSTVGMYGSNPPDLEGAIGYDGESVNGMEKVVSVWNWQETRYLSDSQINLYAYYALTGMVNSDSFEGFDPGQVLFLGASGQQRGTGKWEVTFKFAYSPNLFNIAVGSITGIAKKGWEYMWVRYADTVDTTAKAKVKRPVAVYIESIYDTAPFSILGL